jgi:hypothetical protein
MFFFQRRELYVSQAIAYRMARASTDGEDIRRCGRAEACLDGILAGACQHQGVTLLDHGVGPYGRGIGESIGGGGVVIADTCEVTAQGVGGERAKANGGVFDARGVAVERLVAARGVGPTLHHKYQDPIRRR